MPEVSKKISVLLEIELDQEVTKDDGEVIAMQLETIARDDIWSAIMAGSDLELSVVSVLADVVDTP